MHGFKNVFALDADGISLVFPVFSQQGRELVKSEWDILRYPQSMIMVKYPLQNGLADVQHVDALLGENAAYIGNNADAVFFQ